METLLEDYKRRLQTAEKMISENTNNGSINDIKRAERLQTKASEYRTFIVEIERAMARTSNDDSGLHLQRVSESFLKSLVVENIVKSYGVDLMLVKELAAEIRKL